MTLRPQANCLNSSIVVAGCGEMGAPILRTLRKAGLNAQGYDIAPKDLELLSDAKDIANADILMVVVRDQHEIAALLFDQQAVYKQQHWPQTLIISSTVSPATILALRQQLPDSVELIDAPMSGAPHAAANASLSYMLGGEADTVNALMPLFDILAEHVVHVGPLGSGMTAKVMNNYVAATSVVAVRRSLARAQELGLNPKTLLKIMRASSGATWYGNEIEAISWAKQNYNAKNTIGIIEKDVGCALDAISNHSNNSADHFDCALLEALQTLPDYPAENK